jgi:hypothetical protein
MPKYIIERQYLEPVYQHLVVEGPDVGTACAEGLDETKHGWEAGHRRDATVNDTESARPHEITRIVKVPEDREAELDDGALDGLCYELPALDIPPAYQNAEPAPLTGRELAAVLAGLRQAVATDGGTVEALSVEEIDALCERLNTGVRPLAPPETASVLDDLIHEYIALAIETKQPPGYRENPALIAAAAMCDRLNTGGGA